MSNPGLVSTECDLFTFCPFQALFMIVCMSVPGPV